MTVGPISNSNKSSPGGTQTLPNSDSASPHGVKTGDTLTKLANKYLQAPAKTFPSAFVAKHGTASLRIIRALTREASIAPDIDETYDIWTGRASAGTASTVGGGLLLQIVGELTSFPPLYTVGSIAAHVGVFFVPAAVAAYGAHQLDEKIGMSDNVANVAFCLFHDVPTCDQ